MRTDQRDRPSPSLWRRLICLLDAYGYQANSDPRRQPQSAPGALTTLVVASAVCTLLVFIVLKYDRQEQTIRMGGRAPLNGLYQYTSGGTTKKQTWRNVFVPSLSLKYQSKIVFFNRKEDPRSIFKVEVIDRNGFQETYTSDLSSTPVGYAVYSKHKVNANIPLS
jgi:hypothetical protein